MNPKQPSQNERLAIMENNILHMGQGVQDIKLMLKDHMESSAKREENFITKVEADIKYANKETERNFNSARKRIKWVIRLAVITLVGILVFMFQQFYIYKMELKNDIKYEDTKR